MAFSTYFDFTSKANQNFIPILSGLFAIYWINLQRALVGNNCSSTVIFSSGLLQTIQLSTNLSQTTEIKANYSFVVEIALCSAYQSKKSHDFAKVIFIHRFYKKGTTHFLSQNLRSGRFFLDNAPRTYKKEIKDFSLFSGSFHSSLFFTLWASVSVHS